MAAEEARIRLDHESSAQIVVPFLCRDDSGAPVRFRHVLTRGELDALLEPVVRRSLKVCERLLGKRNLGFDDLERVVVSGGPVRDPYFARLLAEQGGGLDKRIASSVDPFTAVVQGAALYRRQRAGRARRATRVRCGARGRLRAGGRGRRGDNRRGTRDAR